MSVLITGVAGFIGSHVAAALVEAGHEVVGLDDLSGGFERNVPAGVRFVPGSILDVDLLQKLFAEHRFQYVFHLAAYAAEGLSHFIRRFNYTNNVVGSMNLINESVKAEVKCFVFTSSIAVYGAAQLPMRESTTPEPEDPYGIAKYSVELDLHAARRMFGLNSVIFRPHNVYGERQHIGDRYRNVVGIFMNQVLKGEEMSVFGDGSQTRAFSYIGDMARAIARSPWVPEAANRTFNVGADEATSVLELATLIARTFGVDPRIKFLPARKEVQDAVADHSEAYRVFGRGSKTPLAEGVRLMADWAKALGPQEPTRFENIEVHRHLPPSWAAAVRPGRG